MEEEMSRRRNGHDEAEELTAPKSTKRPRGERTVNDDEVDEFFAILKRLQEVKRLKSSCSSGNESKRCGATWQPVFTLDDFKEVTNGRDRKHRARNEQDDANDNEVVSTGRFDLNAEPEVESTNC
jgi:NPR1 interacting